jgi:peroxiredoxin
MTIPRRVPLVLVTLTTLTLAALADTPRRAPVAQDTLPAPTLSWRDLAGKNYGASEIQSAPATVFFFSSTQCPIAGQYAGRMREIAQTYGAKGVRFFAVNANSEDTAAKWQAWLKSYNLPVTAVKDNGTQLADALNATATPSAVVVNAKGEIVYLGRIDDSVDRNKVTRHDLREALDDVLASRAVKVPRTRPFGCEIAREKPALTVKTSGSVTYSKQVAAILNKNCVVCHRSGDVGPFPLTNYKESKPWASAIAHYTSRRLMPPWKATPGHGDFVDSRWLSEKELATLAQWAKAGAPEGNKKDLPPPPSLHPAGEWSLGKPDVVLKPARAFRLEAEGEDVYRDYTLPMDFTEDRYVSAFDFRPGNRAIVHHMIAYIDITGATAAAKEGKDGQPGWAVNGAGSGIRDEDWGEGWAPGMTPRRLEPGIAVKVPKGAKLVLQVHYHKSGKPETDQSELAVYWAKEPVKKVFRTVPVGTPFLRLKPNVANQTVRAGMVLPFSVDLHAIFPHMHMLGKEMKVTAKLPDGTEKSLIWIQNWEFNWQMGYRYVKPMRLPRGTRLSLIATYDNTASNPNQPSHPPKLVTFGEQTTDEMCFAFLGYTRATE